MEKETKKYLKYQKCKFCNKKFKFRFTLNRHLEERHPNLHQCRIDKNVVEKSTFKEYTYAQKNGVDRKVDSKFNFIEHSKICENGSDDQIQLITKDSMSKHLNDSKKYKNSINNMLNKQNLTANNVDLCVNNNNNQCTSGTDINSSGQNNNETTNKNKLTEQTYHITYNSKLKNCDLYMKKDKISNMSNVTDENGLECLDQVHASNSLKSNIQVKPHNIIINNFNIIQENSISENMKKKHDLDQIDESNRIIKFDLQTTSCKNDVKLNEGPEENHDNMCIVKESKYFSIKKSLDVEKIASLTTALDYRQASNSNVIYMCYICKKSSIELHSFAVHMSSHKECSMHECCVCNLTFSTIVLWTNHMINHQYQADLNSSNSQIQSPKVELNTDITTDSMSVECQVHISTSRNTRNNSSIAIEFKDSSISNIIPVQNSYSCNNCTSIFPNKLALNFHRSIHNKSKPFACKYCKKTFFNNWSRNKHEKNVHHFDKNKDTIQDKSNQSIEIQNNLQINNRNVDPILTITKKKERSSDICGENLNKRSLDLMQLRSHVNSKYPVQQIARSSNLNNGVGNISHENSINKCKVGKLSTEIIITNSSVTEDGNLNNLADEISDDAFTGHITHSNHKACTNHIKSHNLIKNKKVQNLKSRNLNTVKVNRNEEHSQEKSNNSTEIVNCSSTKSSITNLTNANHLWFSCDVCEEKYSNPFLLIVHRNSHLCIKPYVCKICNKSYNTKYYWNRHLKSHYPNEVKSISKQKNETKSDTSTLKTKLVQRQTRYHCGCCKKGYYLLFHWKNHLLRNQKCYDYLGNNTSAKSIQNKKSYPKFTSKCRICTKTFCSRIDCNKHLENVHQLTQETDLDTYASKNVIKQKTKLNTKTIKQNSKLPNQKKCRIIPHSNKSLICEDCGKSFSKKYNLNRHRAYIHKVDNSVIHNTTCTLEHNYAMMQHLKFKHNQYSPNNKSINEKQIKQHHKYPIKVFDVAQYFCKICKIELADNSTLQYHIRIHTSYKPVYKCKDCNKIFRTNFILGKHILKYHASTPPRSIKRAKKS